MKLCPRCNKKLDESKFYTRSRGDLSGWCKKCTSLEASQRITNKRRELKKFAVEYKGHKCQLCGFDKSIWALVFHHLDPSTKDVDISMIKNKSKLISELEKCILLCSNCHMEIHAGLHLNILFIPETKNKTTIIRRQRVKDYIDYLGGKCIKCGYNKCSRSMDFHHEKEKEVKIGGKVLLPPLEKMKDELDKCTLMCTNCHRAHHEKEQALPD